LTNPSATSGGSGAGAHPVGSWSQPGATDDGWGPATTSKAKSTARSTARPMPANPGYVLGAPDAAVPPAPGEGWHPAGPVSGRDQRAIRRAEHAEAQRAAAVAYLDEPRPAVAERGLPWWAALLILIAIAGVGGVIDTIGTTQARGGFNIGIVIASVVAILIVRRSHMFPVVIAPPIVYSAAALFQLYLRSSGLHDKKVVLDAAANYLVYGFPAIAAASAAVLIIAGIRLIIRK
jgi:hypothetical protein